MDVDLYLEVRQLFQTKWDPAVLAVLAKRPCRYLALARRLRRVVDDQLVDGHVTRCLARLQDRRLIRADIVAQGQRQYAVYGLTDDGRRALEAYRVILTAYARARSGDPDDACCHGGAYTTVRSGDQPERGTNDAPLHIGESR
jgi:DNA-binding PadR family transcriptional regulator